MKQISLVKLASLWLALTLGALGQATPGKRTVEKIEKTVNAVSLAKADPVTDALLGLLPEADLVGVLNVQRAFQELLPKLKNIGTGGIGKTANEIETFTRLSGIDPQQIQAAVIGVKLTETLSRGTGVVLLQGVAPDMQKFGAAAKAAGSELKTSEHNGKPYYSLGRPAAATQNADEQLHFALLPSQRLAIGDLAAIKTVLDGVKPLPEQLALGKALLETKAGGMVRFAGNLPGGLRKMMADQGELFAQLAAVKTIFGSFDLYADNSAVLDARLRTGSANDASLLRESLGGLIFLGKAFLGGNDDPNMQAIGQMIDQVKINVQANDVTLALNLPKEVVEKLTK